MAKLTAKQQRFVEEYLVDLNATQAAIRAGYSAKLANTNVPKLLQNTAINTAIQEAVSQRSERTEITQDNVLKRLWEIATANPNDIVKFRRVNCRFCWGIDHGHQWTHAEFEQAKLTAMLLEQPVPEANGGFNFDKTRVPHPDCPECKGEGRGEIYISDTSKLTGAAALLYAGAKEGKFGIEVLLHDQVGALIKVGQHLGLFNNKIELTGKNGEPIQTHNLHGGMTLQEVNKRIEELQAKNNA